METIREQIVNQISLLTPPPKLQNGFAVALLHCIAQLSSKL